MSDNKVALQANFKTSSGALLNVYGETAADFEINLKFFIALLDDIKTADALVHGTQVPAPTAVQQVAQALGATVISETPIAQPAPVQAAPAPAAAPGQVGTPVCKHGPMEWIDGATLKTPKSWKGWFCPEPKESTDKCAPQFAKR